MNKPIVITAAVFALLAVVLGAMGAHFLEKHLSPAQLSSFETAVRYQMYHALALLILGLTNKVNNKLMYSLFIAGICLFSGSIYILSTSTILQLGDVSFLGPITPVGGLSLIIAWAILIFELSKRKLV